MIQLHSVPCAFICLGHDHFWWLFSSSVWVMSCGECTSCFRCRWRFPWCLLMPFGICFLFPVLTHSFRSFSDWNKSDLVFEHHTCFVSYLLLRKNVKDHEKHEAKKAPSKWNDVRIFLLSIPSFLDLKTTNKEHYLHDIYFFGIFKM